MLRLGVKQLILVSFCTLVLWDLRMSRYGKSPDMGIQEAIETSLLSDGS